MERLIHSNPIPSSKFHAKPTFFLPRLARFDPSNLGFSRRVNSLSCKIDDSSSNSSPLVVACRYSVKDSLPFSSPKVDLVGGSLEKKKPHSLKQFADALSKQIKAVSTGSVMLLSALIMILMQPVIVSPSLASVQAATKARPLLFRSELLTSAWTGFFAGCLHTLSGPDHLAALAPLSIGRTRFQSALVGALWGCGHDAGQLIFGLLFLLLKDQLHIEIIRTWGTRVVGLTLLVIGGMGIREASEVAATAAPCAAGECDVSVFDADITTGSMKKKKKIGFATFATGVIHGLQPDALMMVLPALALPSRVAGAAFLGMFLLGTVISMGSYTVFIGSCTEALRERVPRITEKLTWASSLVAIALGLGIIFSQFLGFSLY